MSDYRLTHACGIRIQVMHGGYRPVGPLESGFNCIRLTVTSCDSVAFLLIPATNSKIPCINSVVGWTADTIFARCPSCERTWEFDNALRVLPCFQSS